MSDEYLGRSRYVGLWTEPDTTKLSKAAPAMLEVCKAVVSLYEYRRTNGGKFAARDIWIYKKARAAIKRIEGREDEEEGQ